MDWYLTQQQGFQQCSKQLEDLPWALRGVCNDMSSFPLMGWYQKLPAGQPWCHHKIGDRHMVFSEQSDVLFLFFLFYSIFTFWVFLWPYLGCQCIWHGLWSPRTPKVESSVLGTEKPASLGFSMDPGHTFMWQELYLKHKIILFCSLHSPYRNNSGFQDPFSELLRQSCPTWTLGLPWLWLMYCKSNP